MIRKKFEIIFKQYKQFELLLSINFKNSGFVTKESSKTEAWMNYFEYEKFGINMHSLFKLQILHFEQFRAEISTFFSNIQWTKNQFTDCVNPESFQNYIFSREIDSPLKEFFLLYQPKVSSHNKHTNILYDPLAEELTMKQHKQKQIRTMVSQQMDEIHETDEVQNYFRKLYIEHSDTSKQAPPTSLLFSNGDLYSSSRTKEENKTIYSTDLLKATIEEAFTQHELMDFLTILFPSLSYSIESHVLKDLKIMNHGQHVQTSSFDFVWNRLFISPLLRKHCFHHEKSFITSFMTRLLSQTYTLSTQLENVLNLL